ncbi:MAG: Gfo/Idh/MocA family oxidoreductase, partial [Candidatus Odinarchaeota archaeon]
IKVPFSGSQLKVYGEPLQEELLNLIDCIDGAEPLVSIDDGIAALRIAQACRESMEKKLPIKVIL